MSSSTLVPDEHPSKKPPEYSIIYLIHGDANYLYHKNGESFKSDEEVLKEAFSVATGVKNGEVFIFHQKPERHFLFLFPKKDRDFYHFKNGNLIQQAKYSPTDAGFEKEAELYKNIVSKTSRRTFLAYFGHEIPLKDSGSYHQSRKDVSFSIPVFINGLKAFGTSLDLVLLSTCNGGNPYQIHELTTLANTVVASPQNLHLSHLSSFNFSLLRDNPTLNSKFLADTIASDSFNKLASFVETEITVATYSMGEISSYSYIFSNVYQNRISTLNDLSLRSDNKDCLDLSEYYETVQTKGVTSYYKSSSFGRNSAKKKHSGWGCKQ